MWSRHNVVAQHFTNALGRFYASFYGNLDCSYVSAKAYRNQTTTNLLKRQQFDQACFCCSVCCFYRPD